MRKTLAWLVTAILLTLNVAVSPAEVTAEGSGWNQVCQYRADVNTGECGEFCKSAWFYHCGGACFENGGCVYPE
jgi:hypothetical protein